jgi:type I site-specific restriction-modification system R (restriction) subunit
MGKPCDLNSLHASLAFSAIESELKSLPFVSRILDFREPGAERVDEGYRDVVLDARLRGALERLNPHLPAEALEEAYRKLTRLDAPSLPERNRARASDAREWRDGRVPARWGAGTSRH